MRANHRLTGTHTIRLPAGNFIITRAGRDEDDAVTGDLDIKGKLSSSGPGRSPRPSSVVAWTGCSTCRSGSLILQDLTVRGGFAQNDKGGGIRATAPLTLNRVHLASNVADSSGGGIYTEHDLSIVRSTISANVGVAPGGGTSAIDGLFGLTKRNVSIRESTIGFNRSSRGEVPFQLAGVNTEILHSTIAKNLNDTLFTTGFVVSGISIFRRNLLSVTPSSIKD